MSKESPLEEKLAALQKVVQDGKGGTNAQKYDILWNVDKLIASANKNDVASSGMQSKFFQLLFAAINQGCSSSVARVIAVIISKLVDVTGDTKQLLNLLKSIQNAIVGKSAAPVKNTAMEVLGLVSEKKGLSVAAIFVDTANILIKQIKANEPGTKPSAFKALRGAIIGAGSSGQSMYEEIFKTAKSCAGDKSPDVKIAAIRCVGIIAKMTTWLDVLEKIVSFNVKFLDDDVLAVRLEAANFLGNTLVQAQIAKTLPANATSAQGKTGTVASVVGVSAAPLRRLPSSWDLEGIITFISDLYSKATKKEIKAVISHVYVRYLCESKPAMIEKNTELIVTNVVRMVIPTTKILGTQPVDPLQGLSCVRYILREGLTEKLGETGQQNMIKILTKFLSPSNSGENEDKNELVQVAAMREISAQLIELGEGGLSMGEALGATIMKLLSDRSPAVRLSAATCLRALSTALPKYTASQLSLCLSNLTVIFADFDPTQPDSLRGSLSSLKGNAHAAAALIASIRHSNLGVPISLLNYVMQTATALLGNLDVSAAALMLVRVEAGWALVDALVSTMGASFVEPIVPTLLSFWKTTFSIGGSQVVSEREIAIFCRTRSDALCAIGSLATYCPTLLNQKVIAQLLPFLSATLTTTLGLPSSNSSFQPSTIEAMRMLELNLLRAYYALPPTSYTSSHANILRMVASLMLDGPASSTLKQILHADDAPLGPWEQGDEGTLEQLCETVSLPHQDASVVWARDASLAVSNQHSTEVKVVDASIRVFVLLFVSHNEKHRLQLLTHLANSIKDCGNANQRATMQANSLCAMVQITKMMTEKRLSIGKGDALSTMQKFIQKFIGENSPLLRRAAGESLGYLCNSEGDAFTASLVRSITELIKKPSKDVSSAARAGAAFVLACIQRSVGGIMAQRHIPASVGSLHVLAQDSSPHVATWAIHALCVAINEAGLSFSSFATPTLMLVSALMQNENFLGTTGSTSAYLVLGQLVNAIIGALGPELKPGSPTMLRCEAVCAEMETHPNALVQLEAIYFKQKLVLFAPHTADLVSFLPSMVQKFSSPVLSLRSAAVTCLKQLVQASLAAARHAFQLGETLFLMKGTDEAQIVEGGLLGIIFLMLDRERDLSLRSELQLLLSSLLDMAAPTAPLPWLTLCKAVVLSASSQQADSGPVGGPAEEDEEVQSAVGSATTNDKQEYVYRWYTKVFAMECVRRVMAVLKGQHAHFDLVLARQLNAQTQQDFLVIHLHDLVAMAFKAATSETDSLRPVGVWTLKDIVEGFANAVDPDYEGHSLLELYQAQIVSALRPAFAADALPTLTSVACSVLVSYVSTATSLEVSAVRKLLALLTIPLVELRDMSYPSYNEKAITLVQVAILSALAQLHNLSLSPDNTETNSKFSLLLAPSLHMLRVHWMAFLRDFAFLSTPSVPASLYKATFHNYSIKGEVSEYYTKNFTTILQATSSLVTLPCWFDGRETDVPEQTPAPKPAAVSSPTTNTYTPEIKEMLKESKGVQDWYVMYGITLKLLTMVSNVSERVAVAMKVFKNLMNQHYLRSSLFGLDACKEFLQVLAKLGDTEDLKLKTEIASLLSLMIDGFEASYFSPSLAEPAFHHILALVMSPLYKYLKIGAQEKYPPANQPTVLPVLISSLSSLSRVGRLFVSVPHLRQSYGPILIYVALQTIEVSHTQGESLFPVAQQALTGIAKSDDNNENNSSPEWEHTVFSALSVLLRSANSKLDTELPSEIERDQQNISNSITALMSLIVSLNAKSKLHHPEILESLQEEFVNVLQKAYATSNNKLKHLAVVVTRSFVQTAAATPSTPSIAFKFLQTLAPHVAIYISTLHKERKKRKREKIYILIIFQVHKSKGVATSPEEELLLTDQVKFLAVAHTLAPEPNRSKILRVLLPCLIRMLQPSQQPLPSIHSISLQLITHLASTNPQDSKDIVASLHPDEKLALETSVRQTVAAANATAAKVAAPITTTTSAPKTGLTFDFSKYGK